MEPISAYAVYSGLEYLSKRQRKRRKKMNNQNEKNNGTKQKKIVSILKKTKSPIAKKKVVKIVDNNLLRNEIISNNVIKTNTNCKFDRLFKPKSILKTNETSNDHLNCHGSFNVANGDSGINPIESVNNNSKGTIKTVTFQKGNNAEKPKAPENNEPFSEEDDEVFPIGPLSENYSEQKSLKVILPERTYLSSKKNIEKLEKQKQLIRQARQSVKETTTSELIGKKTFGSLISPHQPDNFMRDYWEKRAVYIPQNNNPFGDIISSKIIDEIVHSNVVMYGKHLDVTSYSNGVRETHNPEGRVHSHVMWDYYSNGCSIRLLNPQFFIHKLHNVLATLQEYFGCLVGANAYLTPPDSQGFAPHYDDIEAFVVQIEGQKLWKVYEPRDAVETLPCFSSPNFTDEEVGSPIMEVTLKPGDVLYFPRGFIHQANTVPGHHSLHVTISTYQRTAWCDLMEKVLPLALKRAVKENVEFRTGLPLGYSRQAGVAHRTSGKRREFVQQIKKLINKLEFYLDIDTAVDQVATQFMHDALPPVLTDDELNCTVFGDGPVLGDDGKLINCVQLEFHSKIRLLRANFCRLVIENVIVGEEMEQQLRLYHTVDNSKEYHGEEPQYLILPQEMGEAVRYLISEYPKFTTVSDLPCENDEMKISLASDLWERGILMTDVPLQESRDIEDLSDGMNFGESKYGDHNKRIAENKLGNKDGNKKFKKKKVSKIFDILSTTL